MRKLIIFTFAFIFAYAVSAQTTYQLPPQEIQDVVNAPLTPSFNLSPDGSFGVLLTPDGLVSIEKLSQPELRLGGLRINPITNGQSRSSYYNNISVQSLSDTQVKSISGLPENYLISETAWSPDGKKMAFTIDQSEGIELWYADFETESASKLTEPILNTAIGSAFSWDANSESLICQFVKQDRGELNLGFEVPTGPIITENNGEKAVVRTYQDLLKSPRDEKTFDYFATSELHRVSLDGKAQSMDVEGVITNVSVSPDGNYLLIEKLQKPYSYLVPYYRFPTDISIYSRAGKLVKQVMEVPLAESIPQGFDACRTGERSHRWRADQAASLVWVEALDGGNPKTKVDYRDECFQLDAPFDGSSKSLFKTKYRFGGITWGDDELAVFYEQWWASRKSKTNFFNPSVAGEEKVFVERNSSDMYADPGNFKTKKNKYGRSVLKTDSKKKYLYLFGKGASQEGDRPFVDQYALATGKTVRLWRSEAPYYEYAVTFADEKMSKLITRRESTKENPNYYFRTIKNGKLEAITHFPNPYPVFEGVEKEVVKYTRNDGVALTGDLYLPKGYQPSDGPLPVFMWAYPREYKSARSAAQVKGSPYRFISVNAYSPILYVTQGYAVFNNASFPIVGEGDAQPNDTFVEQLVANAQAAIDVLVEKGVADRDRIAVGGHSYGAFMTANLLAHCDLFAAGIARSGAYNRTLTPFGFQREERTYWQAPHIYNTMSPFMNADKIDQPLLMIHGVADNNSGTYPMQSERLYNALKGHGATARLVMLPAESHGYKAKESLLHVDWEMYQWLEKHVKNKK